MPRSPPTPIHLPSRAKRSLRRGPRWLRSNRQQPNPLPKSPKSKPVDAPIQDPFADPAAKKPAATKSAGTLGAAAELVGLAEPAMRRWQDDTGEYRIHGKLVKIMTHTVRILKDTGKYTTVPMDRLSRSDLQYVQARIAATEAGVVGQTAQK